MRRLIVGVLLDPTTHVVAFSIAFLAWAVSL